MKNYQLIQDLITYVATFEEEQPQAEQQTLFNFITWMNRQLMQIAADRPAPIEPTTTAAESPDVMLGILIGYLYRYSRVYTKKGLENTPLVTYDDFTYLATLWAHQPMTKIDLIERNIQEKTTGTEIIRRLLANDLVEQYNDEVDKRSKRLKLTEKGVKLLNSMWPVMGQVATLLGGTLTLSEKMVLVGLLQKLHIFHNPIFLDQRDEPLDRLLNSMNK
ncbi:MarR family winged helix-turn-helix transcriptional regulator [Spirosoma soli]|uniref:MarR family winged helix-turn-helix transcriptional regulator n=1 Tax=Spirosoma soli TaxID=1770529 RepID=A0ABW5MEY7_9BACT